MLENPASCYIIQCTCIDYIPRCRPLHDLHDQGCRLTLICKVATEPRLCN